jgi:formylglycine-generating enzyme required for sulfatase activity
MLRRLTYISILLIVSALSACGKKEDAVQESAPAVEAPRVVPGGMVLIPAGEFIAGSDDKESFAFPKHKVTLPAFWIDKYEVTNYEFQDFSIKTGYAGEGVKEGRDWRLFYTPEKAHFPVVYITWNDAAAYCKSLGKRLPTEEEWEKAARGTDGRRYPWGNEWADSRSNTYEGGPRKPVAIGEFHDDVSPYGVHDMLGNVQEWTASWFTPYKGNLKKDPSEGRKFRVVRGLAYQHKAQVGDIAIRSAYPEDSLFDFGCRCAKDATPEDIAKASQTE